MSEDPDLDESTLEALDERDETAEPDGADEESTPADDPSFERLLLFLKESRAFDFTGYKRPSLMRRVRHRMREVGIATF